MEIVQDIVEKKLQEVVVQRSMDDIEVIVDAQDTVHTTLKKEAMKKEIVRQLTGFYHIHGIRTIRRTELIELCNERHGLLKGDSKWGIHHIEKPIDDLVDEGIVERIQYLEPLKATYLRLTNSYVNENLN